MAFLIRIKSESGSMDENAKHFAASAADAICAVTS